MAGLHLFLVILLAVSLSYDCVCGAVLEMTVKPEENVTVYCDCELSTGIYIVWYRNCSHDNQPSLVLKPKRGLLLKVKEDYDLLAIFNRFQFVRNISSNSYDLLIKNITHSEEGLYFCGTGQRIIEENGRQIVSRDTYSYGNDTTRIILRTDSDSSDVSTTEKTVHVPWMMMFTPAISVLSTFISLTLVFHLWEKKGPETLKKIPHSKARMSHKQDEDLCLTEVVFWPQDKETHK